MRCSDAAELTQDVVRQQSLSGHDGARWDTTELADNTAKQKLSGEEEMSTDASLNLKICAWCTIVNRMHIRMHLLESFLKDLFILLVNFVRLFSFVCLFTWILLL